MISKFLKMLFYRRRKERLARIPRILANPYKHTDLTDDVARVMRRTRVRDLDGVKLLMKRHHVSTVDDLIDHLQPEYTPVKPMKRLRRWLIRLMGYYPSEPVVSRFVLRMKRQGRLSSNPTEIWQKPTPFID